MAGTAPTDFDFTRTLYAGPVHCSVWLFLPAEAPPNDRSPLLVNPIVAVRINAIVSPTSAGQSPFHPGAALPVARVNHDGTARDEVRKELRDIVPGSGVGFVSEAVQIVIQRNDRRVFQPFDEVSQHRVRAAPKPHWKIRRDGRGRHAELPNPLVVVL
jgi:hypothetical protein